MTHIKNNKALVKELLSPQVNSADLRSAMRHVLSKNGEELSTGGKSDAEAFDSLFGKVVEKLTKGDTDKMIETVNGVNEWIELFSQKEGLELDQEIGNVLSSCINQGKQADLKNAIGNTLQLSRDNKAEKATDNGKYLRTISNLIAGQAGKLNQSGYEKGTNIPIPLLQALIQSDDIQLGQSSGVGNEGGDTLPAYRISDADAPYLWQEALHERLGVRRVMGVMAKPFFIRVTAVPSAASLTESGAITRGTITFSRVDLTPHRIGVGGDYTLQLSLQDGGSVAATLASTLARELAQTIDQQIIEGTGSGNQLRGVYYQPGINVSTALVGTPLDTDTGAIATAGTFAQLSQLLVPIQEDNVNINGVAKYLIEPQVLQMMGAKQYFENSGKNVKEAVEAFYDVEFISANQVTSRNTSEYLGLVSRLVVGVWDNAMLFFFSNSINITDPYGGAANGEIREYASTFVDFHVRQPKAFLYASAVPTPGTASNL